MSRVSTSIVASIGAVVMALATIGAARPTIVIPVPVQQIMAQDKSNNREQLQLFTGTIVSMSGGTVFLKDDAKNARYGLDNQSLARKFVDKKVSVAGALDKAGVIHIKSIEEQKA